MGITRASYHVSVGAVPRNVKKAKKARNTTKAAGKLLREKGSGRCVPNGSAESESGPYDLVILRKKYCRDICKCAYGAYIPVSDKRVAWSRSYKRVAWSRSYSSALFSKLLNK